MSLQQRQTLSSSDHVIVIPHMERPKDERIIAAVYCRVSGKHEDQAYSLDNQIRHYMETVGADPRYELVEIYYDFGISGFKVARPGFHRMLEESKNGKFELVFTKSITRFARNTGIVLDTTRLLKERGIGVYFELQGINTLGQGSELLMTLFAAFGQAESEANRLGTRMAIHRKVRDQKPIQQIQRVFGYTKNADGKIVPDEDADRVREIFEMAADGFTVAQITNYLNGEGVRTKNDAIFYRATVARIIRNEEYKGDFVQFRHFVDEHRKERRNTGEQAMIYYTESHPPIVTNELWEKAQKALGIRKQPRQVPEERLPIETQEMERWEKMKHSENPLDRLRGKQMIELTAEGRLDFEIPELTRMVLQEIQEITVHSPTSFTITFLDGTVKNVRL